ncbi:hypothetical protein DAI22_08g252400 [Oryza sativa Japonica Group]|nr:hypothetical protein DAI22_08g252400 [Oryza sativa Japonica Group]
MNSRRDFRSHRAALFDGIEEGAIRSSAYSSQIHEHENDQAMDSLHDRVSVLKRLTGDIHEEVENHNRMLDRMVLISCKMLSFLSLLSNAFLCYLG